MDAVIDRLEIDIEQSESDLELCIDTITEQTNRRDLNTKLLKQAIE